MTMTFFSYMKTKQKKKISYGPNVPVSAELEEKITANQPIRKKKWGGGRRGLKGVTTQIQS